MNHNLCKYCYKEIKQRKELVTGTSMFRLRPYHDDCFNKLMMENRSIWTSWKPVNGESGNIRCILMVALIIWLSFWNPFGSLGSIIVLIAVYPVVLRAMSYYIFERRIPKIPQKQ